MWYGVPEDGVAGLQAGGYDAAASDKDDDEGPLSSRRRMAGQEEVVQLRLCVAPGSPAGGIWALGFRRWDMRREN